MSKIIFYWTEPNLIGHNFVVPDLVYKFQMIFLMENKVTELKPNAQTYIHR